MGEAGGAGTAEERTVGAVWDSGPRLLARL